MNTLLLPVLAILRSLTDRSVLGFVNLALRKPATQSSEIHNRGSQNAVNGFNNTENDESKHLFCSYVQGDKSTLVWWQVDLQATVTVESVKITSFYTETCLPTNFRLYLYPGKPSQSEPRFCFHYFGIFPRSGSQTLNCMTPVTGRFLRLTQVNCFVLCEIEVYDTKISEYTKNQRGSVNLALRKPATQSTQIPKRGPLNAVDGFNNTENYESQNLYCSYVDNYKQVGWWQVDLQATVTVGSVKITSFHTEGARPSNFSLLIYPGTPSRTVPKICFHYNGTFKPSETRTIICWLPVTGRVLRFSQLKAFVLCEVEVYEAIELEREDGVIKDGTFRRSQRKKMKLASPSTYVTKSVLECASYCDYSRDCPYFNYRSTSIGVGICQVPGVGYQGGDAVGSADWSIYRRM